MSAVENVADVLDAAADLLAKPGAWTRGQYARDDHGSPLQDGRNPAAVCWCAIGALEKVSDRLVGRKLVDPLQRIVANTSNKFGEYGHISEWNDAPERTQAEVVAKLREAAALARQEQAA